MDTDFYIRIIACGLENAKKELPIEDYKDLLVQTQLLSMSLTKEVFSNFDEVLNRGAKFCMEWSHET